MFFRVLWFCDIDLRASHRRLGLLVALASKILRHTTPAGAEAAALTTAAAAAAVTVQAVLVVGAAVEHKKGHGSTFFSTENKRIIHAIVWGGTQARHGSGDASARR